MKRRILLPLALSLGFAAGIAAAAPKNDPPTASREIPVLVAVNANGDVTEVTPAYKLRPSFVRLLRDTLQKMITKPATKDGKPVSGQFVFTLAVATAPRGNGESDVNIKYVSGKALPPGTWHWVQRPGRQLALAGQSGQIAMPMGDRAAEQQRINELMG
ncbi:MAG TPA: hypothetical protein VFJ04_02930, partial [Rhodanobacteraceae bacterium]|nr:hypothetical protein [Rhodanobacteraceae bacterium]